MGMHADDSIDQINGLMALESLGKDEINKMYPRQYYPAEISLMVATGEYNESDFRNGYFITN